MKDPFGKDAETLVRREFGDLLTLLQSIPSSVGLGDAIELVEWMLKSKEPPGELLTVDPLEELRDLFRFYALWARWRSHPTALRRSS